MNRKLLIVEQIFERFMNSALDDITEISVVERVAKYVSQYDSANGYFLLELRIVNKTGYNRMKLTEAPLFRSHLSDYGQRLVDLHMVNLVLEKEIPIEQIEKVYRRALR